MDSIANVRIKRVAAPVRQQVEKAVRDAVVGGQFKPGTRLAEARLCADFDVSRSVVREALRQLESEGLIAVIPNHGAMVASVSAEEARQIYEVRAELEGLAGGGFAIHAGAAALQELKAVVAELESVAASAPSGRVVMAIKQRFYAVLLANCGNGIVRATLEQLNNRISFLRATSLSQPGRLGRTVAEIHEIVDAIEQHDAQAAHDACVRHVKHAAECALQALHLHEQARGDSTRRTTQ